MGTPYTATEEEDCLRILVMLHQSATLLVHHAAWHGKLGRGVIKRVGPVGIQLTT